MSRDGTQGEGYRDSGTLAKIRHPMQIPFWSRIKRTGESWESCWEWQGKRLPRGYGRLSRYGEQVYAHRYAYEVTWGPIPEGLHVCHSCDNPACVNPHHLWLGTASDNMRDCVAKGRQVSGWLGRYRKS